MLTTRTLLYNGVVRPYMYAFAYMIFGVFLFSCLEQLHEEIVEDDAESDQCDNDDDDTFWERAEDKMRDFLRHALTAPNATAANANGTADEETSIAETIRAIKQPWSAAHRPMAKPLAKPLKFAVPRKWSVEKSFRFVEALLTSIGYGDVVPQSPAAKLITIVYAAVGLPIFLNAISSTQDTLNEIVDRWLLVYAKIRDNRMFASAKLLTTATMWMLYLQIGSIMFSSIFEHWSYETAFYFCFISLTTIGFGDYVPSTLTGVQTVDVDAVLDAKTHHAAFETVKPTLIILLRHAYTFIGLSLTAQWFDVLKNYFKGRLAIPSDNDAIANGDVRTTDSLMTYHSNYGSTTNTSNKQQQHHSYANNNNNSNDGSSSASAYYSHFNQQLADIDAGAAGNYGGPTPAVAKHLQARYHGKDALRATFASPSLSSPGSSTPRDDRSPSPFRASIIEKIVRL